MKGAGSKWRPSPLPEKTTLKNPSLIKVNYTSPQKIPQFPHNFQFLISKMQKFCGYVQFQQSLLKIPYQDIRWKFEIFI